MASVTSWTLNVSGCSSGFSQTLNGPTDALVLTVGLALGAFSSTFAAPATYLFMWKRFARRQSSATVETSRGLSREDKARGVV